MTRICTKCNESKSIDNFNKANKVKKDRRRSICKKCQRREELIYNHSIEGLITKMFNGQHASSKKRKQSLPTYNKEEFRSWLLSQENFNLLYANWIESNFNHMLIPSVDRIDCDKSYSFDNIELITWKQNLKNESRDIKSGKLAHNGKPNIPTSQFDKNNNFIREWKSISEAAKELKIDISHISKVIRGERNFCGGFIWKNKNLNIYE